MHFPVRYRHRAVAALALLLGSNGCSLVIDANADQCESHDDCAAFAGTICSEQHVCVSGCASNQYCIETEGEYHVCDKVAQKCVNLISDECKTVVGDWADDSAFIFGSILPLQGDGELVGTSIEQAILLAMDDFKDANDGLPALVEGKPPRPLVLVSCDDRGVDDYSVLAGKHVVEAGIPAIIGPTFSSLVTPVVKNVTIPGEVLSISPVATSETITSLEDNGLVWRTSPPDSIQAAALAQYYTGEIALKLTRGTPSVAASEIKVAVIYKGDTYGKGLADAFGAKIGASALGDRYMRRDYGDPSGDLSDLRYQEVVSDVQAHHPHVVMVFGTSEAVEQVLKPILLGWPTGEPFPFIVASDGAVVPALWELPGALPEVSQSSVRERIAGSIPGARGPRFESFVGLYESVRNAERPDTSPELFGPAGAYDATYLLAFSAAYPRAGRITGPTLAEGLKRMVAQGTPYPVGQGSINDVFGELKSGRNIDFDGASGPLDFDVATGEARSNIIFFCMKPSRDGASFNGVFFDSSKPNGGELIREPAATECN